MQSRVIPDRFSLADVTINGSCTMTINGSLHNVEEFFETILSLFNLSNASLELRDGDQAEFLSRRLEQYGKTLRIMYQRLMETSGNNFLRPSSDAVLHVSQIKFN